MLMVMVTEMPQQSILMTVGATSIHILYELSITMAFASFCRSTLNRVPKPR